MSKAKIKDNIVNLLENIIKRSEIIERQSGSRNLLEIDLVMEDLRSLYCEMELLRKFTETDCMSGEYIPVEKTASEEPRSERVSAPAKESAQENLQPVKEERTAQPQQSTQESVAKSEPVPVAKPEPLPEVKPTPAAEEKPEPKPVEVKKEPVKEASAPVKKENREKPILGERYSGNGNSVHERLARMKDDKSIGARMQFKPIPNLKEAIGVNEKFLFINELFNGDLQSYNDAISKLNGFPSIHEAFEFLNELTTKYAWDGQRSADTIEKFANLVQRRHMGS